MSLRHNTTSCTSVSPFGVLQVWLLLSLLLTALVPGTSQETNCVEAELYTELRCMCVKTTSGVHPSYINTLKVIRAGAHCNKVEVIATLKDGKKICLDPEAPIIKKIVQKILQSDGSAA
ncbi:C-X-C motif chemokine 6 isoform X1 [Trichechus manatus latirostris]|uniref:C-X-C motif chemokine n=1 Tax=Trichechus manatus latirostris TaxID=127582 RepID=A0A2Y9RPQ5_TRIMA|nr:C-X-C motif chemokine 6 isoform X1 [Trichechus manatus latirostris]